MREGGREGLFGYSFFAGLPFLHAGTEGVVHRICRNKPQNCTPSTVHLTHHPSSRGWASKYMYLVLFMLICRVVFFFVCLLF